MQATPEEQIQIRCTSCGQRFKVGSELYGRVVECGACEHRFRVTEDTVIRSKKYYPKEKTTATPVTYARLSGDGMSNLPQEQYPTYEELTANRNFDPTPMSRTIAGIVGGVIMVILLLIFLVSGKNSGLLSGMATDKRMILAVFTSLICGSMIVYANPRAKIKAGMFALMGSLLLLLAPIYVKSTPANVPNQRKDSNANDVIKSDGIESVSLEKIREEVGYKPMEKAQANTMNKKSVVGVWLRGTNDSNSLSVYDYLRLITKSDFVSQKYVRPDKSYLVVLINSKLTLNEVSIECQRIGEVMRTIPELNLVEVKVANAKFNERPEEVLNDPQHSAFYEMNLLELEGINERRINSALKRLSLASPTQSRTDIIRRMNQLLLAADRDELFSNLAKAINHWSNGDEDCVATMMQAVSSRHAQNKVIDPIAIRFLVTYKQPTIIPILDQLWVADPQQWEELYIVAGENAEKSIIPHLGDHSLMHKLSACRICSRIGGASSMSAIRELLKSPCDEETKTSYTLALRTLEERLGK